MTLSEQSPPPPPHTAELVPEGLLVLGTHAGCGKTVVTAGLAGAIMQEGIGIKAFKPMSFHPTVRLQGASALASVRVPGQSAPTEAMSDQAFINQVVRPTELPEPMTVASFRHVEAGMWQRLLHLYRRSTYPFLAECPGNVATPLAMLGATCYDGCLLARELGVPVLLVTEKRADLIEHLVPALLTLKQRHVPIIGWIAVETLSPEAQATPDWESDVLWVSHEYRVPCLGTIPYLPTLSVPAGQAGPLIATVERTIDLLPIKMALQIPAFQA